MKAVEVRTFGGPESLVIAEVPEPEVGDGDVLVEVMAAGVNRADLLARAGGYHRAGNPPLRLGLECSGVVVGTGRQVTGVTVGQRVLCFGAINAPGFYAERAAVPATQIVPLPDDVDFASAACLPTAWLTAWYCLQRLAQVAAGEWVVVHAAASGVGSAAVQIARAAGARVIATARSAAKIAWAKKLGAEYAFDTAEVSRDDLVAAIVRSTGGGAHVVVDAVGGDTFTDSLRAAGPAGRVIALANVALLPSTLDTRDFYPKNVTIHGFQITALIESGYDPRPDLASLLQALADRQFHVPVHALYGLTDAAAAHRTVESRQTLGKVVLSAGPREALDSA